MNGAEYFVEVAKTADITKLHPRVAQFLKDYLRGEKAVSFRDQWVVNTQFPPYPSRAFDRFLHQCATERETWPLYSLTWAVTNRCPFACSHCYNAGRSQQDVPRAVFQALAPQLQERGVVMVHLTGGEPLWRDDLAVLAAQFDARSCVTVGTTGEGLTPARARQLRMAGVFGVGISLDSEWEEEHDRRRGRSGAFAMAVRAVGVAAEAGLYPYVVRMATRETLDHDRLLRYLHFVGRIGAREAHLLEPILAGRLAGHKDLAWRAEQRAQLIAHQREVALREDLPILSTFAYLEAPDTFGCGAGLTHIYIDGSGELCPCNVVPLSFGNVAREPLSVILDRMGRHFCAPRCVCAARQLAAHIPAGAAPTAPEESARLCAACLPRRHRRPVFFRVRAQARSCAGRPALRRAYDEVQAGYETWWLSEAARPVRALTDQLPLADMMNVFEAGCGTGFATALLAMRLPAAGRLLAVDISDGMLALARRRLKHSAAVARTRFKRADALRALRAQHDVDLVFTSWALGYIPLAPFVQASAHALKPGGWLALVVHRDRSPREPFALYAELVAQQPSVLTRRVAFDFPADAAALETILRQAGFTSIQVREDRVVFHLPTAEQVLAHLLKSGAGTVFYEAVDPAWRAPLSARFVSLLRARHPGAPSFDVTHDCLIAVARKT